MPTNYRKRCKRFDIVGDPHFVTFSCYRRLPLLSRDRSSRWMLEAIMLGRERKLYDLWAFVVMPEHVHLVLCPARKGKISAILQLLKQSVSHRALYWLQQNRPRYLEQLAVRRSDGRITHRFWQRGGGYDRNLRSVADVHEKI